MKSNDLEKLSDLKKMLDEGVITSDEFDKMKKLIIQDSGSIQQNDEIKSHKKRWWVLSLVTVGVLLVGGGAVYYGATYTSHNHSEKEVVGSSHKSSLKKKTLAKHESVDDSKDQSNQSQSSAAKETTVSSGWTTAKQAELSTFMAQWQSKMGQQYDGTYDDKTVDHLGFKLAEQIQNGDMDGKIELNGERANVVWDADGNTPGDYQAVAAASGTIPGQMYPTTYLFMLDHGQPIVYMTQTSNGDVLSFTPTANTDLQSGFEKIVNGQVTTNDTSSANVSENSVNENPVDAYTEKSNVSKLDGLVYDNVRFNLGFTVDDILQSKSWGGYGREVIQDRMNAAEEWK